MSCNYAEGLSPYHDKGQLGLEEKFDCKSVVSAKVSLLSKWINEAKHVVIHTGAGISTSAGIPDFRGPKGVWTLQAKGEKPDLSKDFNDAVPTITHMAIMKLVEKEKVKFVVSQNIDGLHLRSNLQRKFLSELHGNMFTEQCSSCHRQFVRSVPVPTVGQKSLNKPCPASKTNGRPCRGKLHDTILDWEHSLPENDLGMADYHSCLADLSICLGTTMQIVPSGNLPLYTKKHGGKLVIVNLQPTKHDRKADLLIHAYVDEVMTLLMKNLNIKIPKYSPKNDPTRTLSQLSEKYLEWTISDYALQKMKKIYEEKCGTKEAKKRLEMIEDDIPLSITKTFKRKPRDEEDSDLEVLDVIVKPKRTRETSKRGSKKNSTPVYNTTITIKKVPPAPKKTKFEGTEKITIKKNVTPTKTKYEIVTKPKKVPKCEIVYNTDSNLCNDLEMICESDDDENTNNFTYNFKRYLYDDIKTEDNKDSDSTTTETKTKEEVKTEVKNEIKVEGEDDKIELNETTSEKLASTKNEEIDNEPKEKNETEKTEIEEVTQSKGKQKDKSKSGEKKNEEENQNSNQASEKTSVDENEQNVVEIVESSISKESESEATSEKKENNEEKEKQNEDDSNENSAQKSVQVEENTPMEVDAADPQTGQTVPEKVEHRKESVETKKSEISESVEKKKESSGTSESQENDTVDSEYQNIEPELPNLTNPNLESQINQIVNQTDSSQYDSSLDISNCNMNSSINENYEFYNNEFINTPNNATDLDYVYNNF